MTRIYISNIGVSLVYWCRVYMPSFFEKLKRGMGIEESAREEIEERIEKPIEKKAVKKTKKPKLQKLRKLEIKTVPLEKLGVEEEKPSVVLAKEDKEKWFESEGQLAIDVYQTENELVIQSAIAGVQPDDLDVIIEKDIITIKGTRQNPCGEECDYFSRECFWGPFSREVILPAEVDPNRAQASMKNGVLVIKLPKILREKQRKIIVKESN